MYRWVKTDCCFMGDIMYYNQQTQWKLRAPTQYTLYQMSSDTVSNHTSFVVHFLSRARIIASCNFVEFHEKKRIKVKVKFTLEQAMKALNRMRHNSAFSLTSTLDESGWSKPRPGQFTFGKETRYPLYSRLYGPKGRSGRVRKNLASVPGFKSRIIQHVTSRYTD